MTVATEVLAVKVFNVSAGTPIPVAFPLYLKEEVFVYYGRAALLAALNVDYTVTLGAAPNFYTFTLTPTAALITKINALIAIDPTEVNFITIRRDLPLTTSTTPPNVANTVFTSREIDRITMKLQQLAEKLLRSVVLPPTFVGDTQLTLFPGGLDQLATYDVNGNIIPLLSPKASELSSLSGLAAGRALVYPASPAPEVYDAVFRRIAQLGKPTTPTDAARRDSISDGIIDFKVHHGVLGSDSGGDAAKIQDAIDAETKNTYFMLPKDDYFLTSVATFTKTFKLDLGKSFITSVGTDALRVDLLGGDAVAGLGRQITIDGGRVIGPSGGNAGLNVNPQGGTTQMSIFQMAVRDGIYAGAMRAVRFGGANGGPEEVGGGETAFNIVENCFMETTTDSTEAASWALEHGAVDGNKALYNMMAGYGVGALVDIHPGAYCVTVAFNTMVNRDGSIKIVNGTKILVLGNQMEQSPNYGDNASPISAMANVEGFDDVSIGVSWHWNNFGGGNKVAYNLVLQHTRHHVIDENQFNTTNAGAPQFADIWFRDEGAMHSALNVVGPNNQPRGVRAQMAAPTDASRRLKIIMDTNSHNQRGVFRPGLHIVAANASNFSGLEFMVTDYGIIMFDGDFVCGITVPAAGAPGLIGTMPPGCRPRVSYTRTVFADDGTSVDLFFGATGEIRLASTITGSTTLNLTGVSHFVLWCINSDYDPGAV